MRLMSKVTVSKLILSGVIAGLMTASPSLAAAKEQKSFWKDRQRGWYWGEDVNKTKELDEKREQEKLSKPPAVTPEQKLEQMQRRVESARIKAMMEPSVEASAEWLRSQKEALEMAERFAKNAELAALANPDLVKTKYPTNNQAGLIAKAEFEKSKQKQLIRFANQFGLIVFVMESCPYCEQFVPVIEGLKHKYDFSVSYISYKDIEVAGIKAKRNINLIGQMKVKNFPAVYAYAPSNKKVTIVANSFLSLEELEHNIQIVGSAFEEQEQLKLDNTQKVSGNE